MKKNETNIIGMPRLTIESHNLQFQDIIGNEIVCQKVGNLKEHTLSNSKVLEDSINIGRIVSECNLLNILEKSSNRDLLDIANNCFNKIDFSTMTKEKLLTIIEEELKILNQIQSESIDSNNIDNETTLKKTKNNKELYERIRDWFNLYGCYLLQTNEVKQYIDLYNFLDKCNQIYLMYEGKKEIPEISTISGIKENKLYQRYSSFFDYIVKQLQLYQLGDFSFIECESCRNLTIRKKKGKQYCSDKCRQKESRKRKAKINQPINALEGNNDNTIKKR